MNIEYIQDKDGIRVSKIIEDKYEQTRKRVTKFNNNRNMSDKEIIEYLAEEIKQDRNKIRCLLEQLKESKEKEIKSEVVELDTTDEIIDNNIKEVTTIITFADGKLIQTITKYEYKEDN